MDFQKGYGKVLDFCLEEFQNYPKMNVAKYRIKHRIWNVCSLLFVKQNVIHQKFKTSIIENSFFSMFIGFQNENEFHGFGNLIFWLWNSLWKHF